MYSINNGKLMEILDFHGHLYLTITIHTLFPTILGSSALLILQPKTGVSGSSDCAILSSLLNISDSLKNNCTV